MDDYDEYDDYDLDDAWLYAEDEFDLADELAENQIAEPGYSGTNFEIAMESYEFELFAFWDDLEYSDDAYWDYALPRKEDTPKKRKRESAGKKGIVDKRQKQEVKYGREDDPLLFVSREQRTKDFFQPPPLLENPAKYTFLPDWRERFANEDGVVEGKDMPVDMKRAADAGEDIEEDDEEEGGWEDEHDEEDHPGSDDEEEGELDADMLQQILKQKLEDAGLGAEDEAPFMQVISKMMSGDDDADELTGNLTNQLLGKLTSNPGDGSALSSWLSQQGVSIPNDEDDDASIVATLDLPRGPRHTALNTRQNAQDSPIDSVVGEKRNATQMPLHFGSPTISSAKKRSASAIEEKERPSKKQKKVTFDVPSSSSDLPTLEVGSGIAADLPTSEDPLMSESTVKQRPTRSQSKNDAPAPEVVESGESGGKANPRTAASRKRKAAEDTVEDKPPEKKKTRKKEVDMLENAAAGSPMGPPARRTRAARAKSGK